VIKTTVKLKLLLSFMLLDLCICGIDLKKVLEIGSDTKKDYIFFKDGPVVVDKSGNIFAVEGETQVIRKYGKDGIYLKEIGKKGQGPMEFMNITSMAIQGDFILICDYGNRKIHQYDIELKYIQSEPLNGLFINIAANKKYCIANKRNGLAYEIVLRKPFTGWEKVLVEAKKIPIKAKYKNSPLALAYFRNLFSVEESSQAFVSTYWYPGNGSLQLLFFDKDGTLLRKTKTEDIVPHYEFDERLLDRSTFSQAKGKILMISGIHYLNEKIVIIQYAYGAKKEDNGVSLVLIDSYSGKIIDRKNSYGNYHIKCTKKNHVYGHVYDSEDADIKIGVFRIE
jgi:hypothetical protein